MGERTLTSLVRILLTASLSAAFLVAATPRLARAQSEADRAAWITVRVEAPRCATFDASAFKRLLEIELMAEHVRVVDGPNPELVLEIPKTACETEPREITVAVRSTSGSVAERSITLGDVPANARLRAATLSVAELLRDARTFAKKSEPPPAAPDVLAERRDEPPASTAPSAQHAAEKTAAPEPRVTHRGLDIQAAARWKAFTTNSLFGAELAATLPLGSTGVDLRVDIAGHGTSVDDPIGQVNLLLYSAGLAALVSTGGAPRFVLGPRVELGRASWEGVADRPTVVAQSGARFVAFAALLAGVRPALSSRWSALAELEVGMTLLGLEARADDRTAAALLGPFGAARVGVAFAP